MRRENRNRIFLFIAVAFPLKKASSVLIPRGDMLGWVSARCLHMRVEPVLQYFCYDLTLNITQILK